MTSKPLLSILMLTYNDANYLQACLRSIASNVSSPFEVILVDNGSIEQIPTDIIEQWPWLRVIRSEKNLGFNAGNNLAAKNAKGKYLLLLNIDTILLTDVAMAVRLLELDRKIGAVGAQAYDSNRKPRPSAGHFPNAWRLWLFRSLWQKPSVQYGPKECEAYRADWVEGSFLMTRRTDWQHIGGFDEEYFFFGNDLHLCRSMAEQGFAVVQCVAVKYVHYCGYGTSRMGNLYAGFREYHKKFSPPTEQRIANFVLRAGLLARVLVYGACYAITRNARVKEKLQGFVSVRRNWARLTP